MSKKIYTIQDYNKGFILFKLLENDKPKILIKKRISSNVTDHKTEYYMTDTKHHFISSIYPIDKQANFKGLFSLSNGSYKFDNKGLNYSLKIDNNTALISRVG